MPDIREEPADDQPSDPTSTPRGDRESSEGNTMAGGGIPRIIVRKICFYFLIYGLMIHFRFQGHLKGRKVDALLWVLRAATVMFGILYVFPIK